MLITEKTSQLNEDNCYVFLVDDNTNKIELKNIFQKNTMLKFRRLIF